MFGLQASCDRIIGLTILITGIVLAMASSATIVTTVRTTFAALILN